MAALKKIFDNLSKRASAWKSRVKDHALRALVATVPRREAHARCFIPGQVGGAGRLVRLAHFLPIFGAVEGIMGHEGCEDEWYIVLCFDRCRDQCEKKRGNHYLNLIC